MQNSKPAKANKKKELDIVVESSLNTPIKHKITYNKTHTTSEYINKKRISNPLNINKVKSIQNIKSKKLTVPNNTSTYTKITQINRNNNLQFNHRGLVKYYLIFKKIIKYIIKTFAWVIF